MGYGEFGGGGSVSWKVDHEKSKNAKIDRSGGDMEVKGYDPIEPSEMGKTKQAPDGHFRVEVMFASPCDAQATRVNIVVQGSSMVFFVKANPEEAVKGKNGLPRYPPQIRVSW